MSIHRLRAIGSIDLAIADAKDADDMIERNALLVYEGEFESMEGPVRVTSDQIEQLVTNHNSALSKLKRLVASSTSLHHYPPVQLDHSVSARDTVGRLVGDISLGEKEMDDGRRVPAVLGRLRILGRENVERVKDGRWTHLSLGADFERGKIAELSITPFPAAADAALLRAAPKRREVYCDYPDGKTKCHVEVDEATGKYHAFVDGKEAGDGFVSKETAVEEAKKVATEKIAPVPPATTNPTQLRSGDDMDTSKLKGYLTGHKKMSEKDADEHLSRLAKPECSEELKKLSMEFDDWAKEEEKEHEKKLTAAREGITRLRAGFKVSTDLARLSATSGRIITRLSKLRADGKVTPAEIKKMDVAKLAASPQNEIDLVLGTYDAREPVVMVGQRGSTKASDLSVLTDKEKEKARIEADSRANMSLLRSVDAAKTKLGSEHVDGRTEGGAPPPVITDDERGHEDHMAYFEKEHAEISAMMASGQHGPAKDRLKAFMTKSLAMSGAVGEGTSANAEEAERHLSTLAENIVKMQAQFDEAVKIAADLAG